MQFQITRLKDRIETHEHHVEKRLSVLHGYDQSIKANKAKVDTNSQLIHDCLKEVNDFKNDDMFVNSKDNYMKLYQELMKQRQVLEFEFRPAIRQTAIDKSQFIKVVEFDDVKER